MATPPQAKPSFSPGRKWRIGFNVGLMTFLVLAVVVMLNYLSRDLFLRFRVSTHTRIELAPRTIGLLRSLTNRVTVTLYYNKDDPLYSTIKDLLKEYWLENPKIAVQLVDYTRDAGPAQLIKAKYKLSATTDKNLVIFDCDGRFKPVDGKALAHYVTEQIPDEKELRFLRTPTAFLGEMYFNAALLDVTSPKRLKACFLTGHEEHALDSGDELTGYLKFSSIVRQNNIEVEALSLLGTNEVPRDCHLLVIAGPRTAISDAELDKIERYLKEGGRLLAMFNFASAAKELGLEKLLQKWGVEVGHNVVKDPDNTSPGGDGSDVVVTDFREKHPLANPLVGSQVQLILPRSVGQLKSRSQAADAPSVEEIAFSGPKARTMVNNSPVGKAQAFPLMVAVEKGAIKDVITERGTTRMAIVGDSFFLVNRQIDSANNRAFAEDAINWLLERTQLVQTPGTQMKAYKIVMTRSQLQRAELILLGGMPGAVLLLGALVWLRRRG